MKSGIFGKRMTQWQKVNLLGWLGLIYDFLKSSVQLSCTVEIRIPSTNTSHFPGTETAKGIANTHAKKRFFLKNPLTLNLSCERSFGPFLSHFRNLGTFFLHLCFCFGAIFCTCQGLKFVTIWGVWIGIKDSSRGSGWRKAAWMAHNSGSRGPRDLNDALPCVALYKRVYEIWCMYAWNVCMSYGPWSMTDVVVGIQGRECQNFSTFRHVDTGFSWLV